MGRLILLILVLLLHSCGLYDRYFAPNTYVDADSTGFVYIRAVDAFPQVLNHLEKSGYVVSVKHFEAVARQMNYPEQIKPGKYKIISGLNNVELVNMLKSGRQIPVNVTFNQVADIRVLAGRLSRQLDLDSSEFVALLNDSVFTNEKLGVPPILAATRFIPDTYEFWWATDAERCIVKLNKAYLQFWTEERRAMAEALGLSEVEVSILASIVQMEQAKRSDEWPRIAGLYLNRLNKGMLLQADPTVKFAFGDMGIQRVLTRHTLIDHPYNTYRYKGLPPGPIFIPEQGAILAVLNAEKHGFLFMCAHYDMSGRHKFAVTLGEHNSNAAQFHRALNQRGIF